MERTKNNKNSSQKLLEVLSDDINLEQDNWTKERMFHSVGEVHSKKWLANILPAELLNRSFKNAVESILTLVESNFLTEEIPDNIQTPDYGDKWGRLANYIEINNRTIAQMHGNCCCKGIISSIKMLPAIPPSASSWANCIILSQIFPIIYGEGYNKSPFEENSLYGIRLNAGYSDNIIDFSIYDKVKPEEQFQAFNEFAHLRGLKTGFRTIISADQIKIAHPDGDDEFFDWHNFEHQELYINEHVKLINMGFECIFFDSAKHIGGHDYENYKGMGSLPEYGQMQYILYEIRQRSGKNTLSFVGEKSTDDFEHYKNMGLTAGTDFMTGDDFEYVRNMSEKCKYNRYYAPGVKVSNDNTKNELSYEMRLNRINTALFGFYRASDKLPSFMQMPDLFPLRHDTTTHNLMTTNPSFSTDGTPESHWYNLFAHENGRNYNKTVGELFAYALNL